MAQGIIIVRRANSTHSVFDMRDEKSETKRALRRHGKEKDMKKVILLISGRPPHPEERAEVSVKREKSSPPEARVESSDSHYS